MSNSREAGAIEQIDVAYVANLARVSLTEDEVRKFEGQLQQIVGFVRKIGQLDLTGIEPTSHATPIVNVFRKDAVRPGLDREAVLANAPAGGDGQFMVPKIVE